MLSRDYMRWYWKHYVPALADRLQTNDAPSPADCLPVCRRLPHLHRMRDPPRSRGELYAVRLQIDRKIVQITRNVYPPLDFIFRKITLSWQTIY
jgi:hypothetical protein